MNDPIKEIDIKFLRERINYWQSRTDIELSIRQAEVEALTAMLQELLDSK